MVSLKNNIEMSSKEKNSLKNQLDFAIKEKEKISISLNKVNFFSHANIASSFIDKNEIYILKNKLTV